MDRFVGSRDCDLVLGASGMRGTGLVGAVLELDELGYRFRRVAGTGSGAVVAALVAGLGAAGRPITHLRWIGATFDHGQLTDGGWSDHSAGAGRCDPGYLREWLGSALDELGVATFGDLRLPGSVTRSSAAHRHRLVVHAWDLTRRRSVQLPGDYPGYGVAHPDDVPIVDAVAAAAATPSVLPAESRWAPAVTMEGIEHPAGPVSWVDRGPFDDFPVDTFDRADGGLVRWPTLGIRVAGGSATRAGWDPPGSEDCLRALVERADRSHVPAEQAARTIFVDDGGIGATDIGLTRVDQQRLAGHGRRAVRDRLCPGGPSVRACDDGSAVPMTALP